MDDLFALKEKERGRSITLTAICEVLAISEKVIAGARTTGAQKKTGLYISSRKSGADQPR